MGAQYEELTIAQGSDVKIELHLEDENGATKNLTNNTPLKLTVTPEQVAEGIYSFIGTNKVVTGETMLMDGGHHLII